MIKTIETKSCKMKEITGFVVETSKKIYIIQANGAAEVIIYKLDADGTWNRYFNVKLENMKGASGLPKSVVQVIKEAHKALTAPVQEEQMSWEDEMRAEIQAKVDDKIQKAAERSETTILISTDWMELKGSKLLDFMEFMFIYSDGKILTDKQYNDYCAYVAEDDGDCSAEDHDINFMDTWSDYRGSWKKANADQLCSCCQGDGYIKDPDHHSATILRYITCPDCQGGGLEIKKATPEQFKKYNETFKKDQAAAAEDVLFICEECGSKRKAPFESYLTICKACGGDLVVKIPEIEIEAPEDDVDYKKKAASIFDRFSVMPGSQEMGSKIPDPPKCMTCFDSGRIADDILCHDCGDQFLEDLSKDADDHLEQLTDEKEQIIQEMVLISQKRGIKGEELDEGIRWMRSISTETLKSYLRIVRERPDLIMPQE